MSAVEKSVAVYDRGKTTVYACQFDQRFAYCCYVPADYAPDRGRDYRLLVAIHGTNRTMTAYRDAFAPFGDAHRTIVLAPLFPVGITRPGDLNSYKFIVAGDLRYDRVLLAMVEEVRARYGLGDDRFAMFGFSGGAHFAHRFLYLHPERLTAVSIGAPGVVTLLDFERDFWVGVRNLDTVFGLSIDLPAMRRVAVQMIVGGEDTETWEITITRESSLWMPGADLAGANRIERIDALRRSFEAHGIPVRHDIVPGVAHSGLAMLPAIEDFLARAAM
jgi:pimeloyl-ACP methyl ester carboxylesterase